MFPNNKTYDTPTADQIEALANDVKTKSNERLNADCEYLLNVFNQTLTESFKDPSKINHSVDIDVDKLNNYYTKITDCNGTPFDIVKQMKTVGVTAKQGDFTSSRLKYTYYHKIDKTLSLYL